MTELLTKRDETLIMGYTPEELACLDPDPSLSRDEKTLRYTYGEQLVRCRRCIHKLGINATYNCAYTKPIDDRDYPMQAKKDGMASCAANVGRDGPML